MNIKAQGGTFSLGKPYNVGSEGREYFVPNKPLSEADEAVKRFKSDEFVNEFRDNLHSSIWKIVGPSIHRALRRIIEDSKRRRAEQWQSVADARERQEGRDIQFRNCEGCDGTGGPSKNCARCKGLGYWWARLGPLGEVTPLRERRARVNNEIWMHGDNLEPKESKRWLLAAVIVSVLVLLMSLYVLSCGATPWGACWK